MEVSKTNRELLLLIREDNMVAFYQLYQRYSRRLYGFVIRYIKREQDAEEIVQDVFVKIWEARAKIDVYSSFESFLFTIAYNTTISLFRKRASEERYLEHLKLLQQVKAAPDLNDEIHFNELNQKVQALLDKLTPRQREIFRLSREEGFTHDEIAKQLGISVLTVKKHITNTLAILKSRMDSDMILSVLFFYLFLS